MLVGLLSGGDQKPRSAGCAICPQRVPKITVAVFVAHEMMHASGSVASEREEFGADIDQRNLKSGDRFQSACRAHDPLNDGCPNS